MTPEQWQSAKEKIGSLLELESAQRSAYLDQLAGTDSELRRELQSLLLYHDEMPEDFLNASLYQEYAGPVSATSLIGKRLGPYQIASEIGKGGMGEVYRALRVDDQYHKEVAIKLIRAERESGVVVTRFKNERQILARLEHPNIARLLDGGTAEGVPYLVMELIEGESITNYCNRHALGIEERLALFLQVCSAVQFAHQRLIIHRDIKPGNILVTTDGIPKLLDFGISKILTDASETGAIDRTMTGVRMLTPAYASPEQIRGEPITTASDVYSLGMVLYELLVGRRPYGTDGSPEQVARAISEEEPERPSTAAQKNDEAAVVPSAERAKRSLGHTTTGNLSKQLRGDLDNIILMALRKEPQRRYASVEQFAEDIRRYLGDLPVIARRDTARYRASKFYMRHKAGVTATAAAVIIVAASLIITLNEARVARLQQARAERRFDDVRRVANSLIFVVHDSIANVPGTTSARKLIVQQGLEYLDRLAAESSEDASLQKELAAGYEKLGDIQVGKVLGNLGDTAGGIASYRKAVAIRQRLARRQPSDRVVWQDLEKSYLNLAAALDRAGNQQMNDEYLRKALEIATTLAKEYPNDAEIRYSFGSCEWQHAGAFWRDGNLEAALTAYKESADQFNRAGMLDPSNQRAHRAVAIADKNIGSVLELLHKPDQALSYYLQASEIDENSLKREPENVMYVRDNTMDLRNIGDVLLKQGKFREARENYEKAFTMDRSLAEKDRSDRDAQLQLAGDYAGVGKALIGMGERSAAIVSLQKALKIHETRVKADPSDALARNYLADSFVSLGDAQPFIGKQSKPSRSELDNSCAAYRRALNIWNDLQKEGKLYKVFESDRSNLLLKMKDCKTASASLLSLPPT